MRALVVGVCIIIASSIPAAAQELRVKIISADRLTQDSCDDIERIAIENSNYLRQVASLKFQLSFACPRPFPVEVVSEIQKAQNNGVHHIILLSGRQLPLQELPPVNVFAAGSRSIYPWSPAIELISRPLSQAAAFADHAIRHSCRPVVVADDHSRGQEFASAVSNNIGATSRRGMGLPVVSVMPKRELDRPGRRADVCLHVLDEGVVREIDRSTIELFHSIVIPGAGSGVPDYQGDRLFVMTERRFDPPDRMRAAQGMQQFTLSLDAAYLIAAMQIIAQSAKARGADPRSIREFILSGARFDTTVGTIQYTKVAEQYGRMLPQSGHIVTQWRPDYTDQPCACRSREVCVKCPE